MLTVIVLLGKFRLLSFSSEIHVQEFIYFVFAIAVVYRAPSSIDYP